MGRFISDASPISCESNFCADNNPVNRRIAVPALPISRAPAGALQAVQADAMNQHVCGAALLDAHAQRAHGGQARQAIFAREKSADLADALGDTGQHQCAMRYGFVAGHASWRRKRASSDAP